MTLILKLDLDMIKMYLHTKNEVSMSSSSKVIAWTGRNTDRQTDTETDTQTHRDDRKHYLPAYAGGNKLYKKRVDVQNYFKRQRYFSYWTHKEGKHECFLIKYFFCCFFFKRSYFTPQQQHDAHEISCHKLLSQLGKRTMDLFKRS